MSRYEHWKSKVKPMSGAVIRISYTKTFSEEQIKRARHGLLPKDMDDKWVGLLLQDTIGFFRSWTGHQIYRLHLKRINGVYETGSIEVLDDPERYRRVSDAHDLKHVERLLAQLTAGETA